MIVIAPASNNFVSNYWFVLCIQQVRVSHIDSYRLTNVTVGMATTCMPPFPMFRQLIPIQGFPFITLIVLTYKTLKRIFDGTRPFGISRTKEKDILNDGC
jgi:hypothetical protein